MNIVFYSPYMPKHSGGGEKYLLDCMQLLLERGQDQVYLALSSQEFIDQDQEAIIINRYQRFFACDLTGLKIISTPLGTKSNFWQKLWWTRQFDRLYYATDGSLFFSLAKKNILHIQVPLNISKRRLIERLKLKSWQIKNTNSHFTKNYVQKHWPVKIDLIHQPLVDLTEFPKKEAKELNKKEIILHVGRFFKQLHSKRQDVLVEIFRELRQREPELTKNWQLILVGSIEDKEYAAQVAKAAEGLPVKIYHDLSRSELLKLYQQASIYWHATGYGLDETKEASAMEHFGIAPIEAMAAYSAPVLIAKGGHREILGEALKELLWENKTDCLDKTIQLMQNKKHYLTVIRQARKRAESFNRERFAKILFEMLG